MSTIVCIAGMHRSGTSMIARLLNLCGLSLGNESDFIKPGPDNPEGFWENSKFVKVNDDILTAIGGGWDFPPTVNYGWENQDIIFPSRIQAQQLISTFEENPVWGWKDPRNSLTIPFWMSLIPDLKVIICLRNPLDVSKSLARRGFTSDIFGFNLWLDYNKRLLEAVPSQNRLITHYDSYFIDPETELNRLLGFVGISTNPKIVQEACTTVLDSIRHNQASLDEMFLAGSSKEVNHLYVEMCQQTGQVFWGNDISFPEDDMPKNAAPKKMEYDEALLLMRKDQEIRKLQSEIGKLHAEIKNIEIVNVNREDELLAQVKKIEDAWADTQSGSAWKISKKLQDLRERLAPIGSRRYKFIRLSLRVFFVWRQEGIRGVWKRGLNNISGGKFADSSSGEVFEDIPKVSIVIPVYNALDLTQACINSIYRVSTAVPFELILVDNASVDGTAKWLKNETKKHQNLKVLNMKQNIGFGPGVNAGIKQGKGNYIVILNNDTIVTTNWLDRLVEIAEKDPSIGLVSPMTNYVGDGPQLDENAAQLSPDVDLIEKYANKIAGRSEIYYEPNRLVFFCVLLKREVVDIIGDLDIGYEKGNFEDDDYCLRIRMAGYKLAIAKNSFVYHHGSVTFKSNKISHTHFMEKNRERFYKKAGRIATASRRFPVLPSSSQKLISVIVRTKDRPLLLQRTLVSLANQTFRDFEVVLVNDGGSDVSSLLKAMGEQFPVSYVSHEISKGRTASVNTGIQHSKGIWLSYLDDDDIVYPWHFESLFQATENRKEKFYYSEYNQALFSKAEMITPSVLQGVPAFEYSRKELLVQNRIPIHTWLHHRDCIEKTGMWDETLDRLEDYDFLLRLSANYSFYHVKKVTCEYRFYMDSANSIYTDRYKTLDALEKIYQRNPVDDSVSLVRRQETLDMLQVQIDKIGKIQENIGVSISKEAAIRNIIHLVTGI